MKYGSGNTYQWLEEAMKSVKTPKFFLVSAAPVLETSDRIDLRAFPNSYATFLRKFGKASFFRDSSNCYSIGIFAVPKPEMLDGHQFWRIGWFIESSVLLRELSHTKDGEWPVFEQSKSGRLRRVAKGFDEWLRLRWESAKADYSHQNWQNILDGPEPFTAQELKIVEARRKFGWKLLSVDDKCAMRFEVTNGSDRCLPYLGIRVHGKRSGVWLSIALPVGHVLPGATACAIYDKFPAGMLTRDEIQVFERPDPEPEDREFYSEFRPLSD